MMNTDELYNLKYGISEFIVPRLIQFKAIYVENRAPTVPKIYPEDIENTEFSGDLTADELEKIWISILDKMIFAFECQIDLEKCTDRNDAREKVNEGLELFAKYFESLWI